MASNGTNGFERNQEEEVSIPSPTSFTMHYSNFSFIAWIIPSKTTAIIMYSVMILLGITVLVVAKHKSRNNTSGSFLTQINGIFDIPNTEDGVYDASRKHH
eukprot:699789_1